MVLVSVVGTSHVYIKRNRCREVYSVLDLGSKVHGLGSFESQPMLQWFVSRQELFPIALVVGLGRKMAVSFEGRATLCACKRSYVMLSKIVQCRYLFSALMRRQPEHNRRPHAQAPPSNKSRSSSSSSSSSSNSKLSNEY